MVLLPEVDALKRRAGLRPPLFRVFTAAVLTGLLGCAAAGLGRGPSRPERPFFQAEVLTGIGDRGQPVATLSVSIPYRNLVFFRDGADYVCSYRIRAVQADAGGGQALREWTGRVEVPDYAETQASSVNRTTVSLDLAGLAADRSKAGPRLEVMVEIDGTSRRARRTVPLRLNSVQEGTLALGELALYRQRDGFAAMPTEVEVMGRALPAPELFSLQEDGRFDLATGEPWLYVRIFDLRGGEESETFQVEVLCRPAGTDSVRHRISIPAERQGYVTSVLVRLPASAFAYGLNDVDASLGEAEPVQTELSNGGLDFADNLSWRAILTPLEGIASKPDYESLRSVPLADRAQAWWDFWDRLDPDPATPENERLIEHFRRVRYARQRLTDGFADGVASDRGKLYIRLGEPDAVEEGSSRFDSFASYQIWRYLDVGFVYYFQDATGSGHFRLMWWEET